MHAFNYREIRTPVFEETTLFSRSIGELTDVVGKEMYSFPDRSGTSLTLKPEMTASVIRSFIQHNMGEQQPLVKLYYIAPMFRQERPQAGRLRQFHQFGAEAIGGDNAIMDAEVIALAVEIYKTLRLTNFTVRINSVGCEVCRPPYKQKLQTFLEHVIDKLSDESKQRLKQNPLRILDSKDEHDQTLTKDAPLMKDNLCKDCAEHFSNLQSFLKTLKIDFTIDGRIVRGLDYYTKTAFEIVSQDLGSQDALTGGGRYDLLVKELGGKHTPAVGFAAGIERLLMVMEKQKLLLTDNLHPFVYIAYADKHGRSWTIEQAYILRHQAIRCEYDPLDRSLKSQMREANRQQAEYVLIVGENELRAQSVSLKNMKTGNEQKVHMGELTNKLLELQMKQ